MDNRNTTAATALQNRGCRFIFPMIFLLVLTMPPFFLIKLRGLTNRACWQRNYGTTTWLSSQICLLRNPASQDVAVFASRIIFGGCGRGRGEYGRIGTRRRRVYARRGAMQRLFLRAAGISQSRPVHPRRKQRPAIVDARSRTEQRATGFRHDRLCCGPDAGQQDSLFCPILEMICAVHLPVVGGVRSLMTRPALTNEIPC